MNLQSSEKQCAAEPGKQGSDHALLLDVRRSATRVGLSVSTLNKKRLDGTGPRYVKLGRRVLYDVRDLNDWIDRHKRSNTSESAGSVAREEI